MSEVARHLLFGVADDDVGKEKIAERAHAVQQHDEQRDEQQISVARNKLNPPNALPVVGSLCSRLRLRTALGTLLRVPAHQRHGQREQSDCHEHQL